MELSLYDDCVKRIEADEEQEMKNQSQYLRSHEANAVSRGCGV